MYGSLSRCSVKFISGIIVTGMMKWSVTTKLGLEVPKSIQKDTKMRRKNVKSNKTADINKLFIKQPKEERVTDVVTKKKEHCEINKPADSNVVL